MVRVEACWPMSPLMQVDDHLHATPRQGLERRPPSWIGAGQQLAFFDPHTRVDDETKAAEDHLKALHVVLRNADRCTSPAYGSGLGSATSRILLWNPRPALLPDGS